jgi:integrase/recombinase XerD
MRQTPPKVIETFDPSEVESLIYNQPDLRDRALVTLLTDTGIRKGGARQLLRRDVAVHTLRLSVRRGKGGKGRVIPLSPRLASAISELDIFDDLRPEHHLWYRVKAMPQGTRRILRERPIVDSGFVAWWNRMVDNAGVAYRSPHVVRHTLATQWLRDGGPLPELSRMLGHSSIKTTVDTYAHLAVEDIETAFAKLLKTRGEA